MKEHPIAAGVWLILVFGGLGYLTVSGMESSKAHHQAEQREAINKELADAIMDGRRGKFDSAITKLEGLVAKHPTEPALHLNLGVAQRAANKVDAADKSFQRVLELDPKDFDAMAERASILLEKDKLDEALALMEQIPENEGRARQRLRDDPLWVKHQEDDRVKNLRKKHEVEALDSSLRIQRAVRKKPAQGVMHP